MEVFVRAAMVETVAGATDNRSHGSREGSFGRAVLHPGAPLPCAPPKLRNTSFLSPYEGSFHPYGVKVLKGEEGAGHRRLRSHG
ncbi:hypothetical protein SY2F82_62770 [Streptomyces sp. Y2F8-2]|nr:hypothetical protein SY2F82_62770 [Streptomyces sp. Y2F8-2]